MELLGVGIEVVAAGDPRAPDLDLALGLPVPWQFGAVVVADSDLDSRPRSARSSPARRCRPRGWFLGAGGPTAASGLVSVMPQAWVMVTPKRVAEAFDEPPGYGGPATDHEPQRREVGVGSVGQDVVEHGGHCAGHRRPGLLDDVGDRACLEELLGHDDVGAGRPCCVGHPPGVGVELGHDQQDAVEIGRTPSACAVCAASAWRYDDRWE